MLKIFRKKIQAGQIADTFVEQFLSTIENGFPEVAALINESPEFVKSPGIEAGDADRFLLIALAANLSAVQRYFRPHEDQEISTHFLEGMAHRCSVDLNALANSITKYQAFISKVNHPSKNLVYGMSKALFHKYDINRYQEEYFRNVNAPNPIFIKRLDEAMTAFMWEWEEIAGN